jgi:hypothetical protein
MLHPHCGVQTVQGPLRQDPSQAAKKRTLLVHDSWTIAERFGKNFSRLLFSPFGDNGLKEVPKTRCHKTTIHYKGFAW